MRKKIALILATVLLLALTAACTPEPEVSQSVDETTVQQIREDYINLVRHVDGDANLLTLRIYGVFNKTVVLFLDEGWITYDSRPRTEVVGEYVFEYPDIQSFRVYHNRRFYYLEDAWEDGYLTDEQVKVIYKAYEEDRYVTVPPLDRSWKMGDPSLADRNDTDTVEMPKTSDSTEESGNTRPPYVEPTESVFYQVTEVRSPDMPEKRRERVENYLEQYRKLAPMTEELYMEVESSWGSANFNYGLSVRYDYYGIYHGYAVFRKTLDRDGGIREVTLGNYTFRWGNGFEFVAYKEGEWYSVTSLYTQGIFRDEDIGAMAAYHGAIYLEDSDPLLPLSESLLTEIGSHSEEPEQLIAKVREGYLGTYEGYVVYHTSGMLDWMTEQYIAGCYFYGSDLGLGTYKDGEFTGLKDLYQSGKISKESVQQISYRYNGGGQSGRVMLPLLDPLPEATKTEIETEFQKQTGRTLSLHEIDYYGTYDGVVCFFARTDQNDTDYMSGVYGYRNGIFLPLNEIFHPTEEGFQEPFDIKPMDLLRVGDRHVANQFGSLR